MDTVVMWLNCGQPIKTFTSAYDVKGQLSSETEKDGSGTTLSADAYTYDANGNQLTDDNLGTQNLPHIVLSSGYDIQGRRTGLTTGRR